MSITRFQLTDNEVPLKFYGRTALISIRCLEGRSNHPQFYTPQLIRRKVQSAPDPLFLSCGANCNCLCAILLCPVIAALSPPVEHSGWIGRVVIGSKEKDVGPPGSALHYQK